jgi:hypothetical protein
MKIFSKKISDCFLAFALLSLTVGCHNYYMASPMNKNYDTARAIDSLSQQHKYFILRNGDQVFHIKNISVSEDNKTFKTTLENLPPYHKMYLNKDRNGKMIYHKNDQADLEVLKEVHLYISVDSSIASGDYVFQLKDVKKIELIQNNTGKTIVSHSLGALVGIVIVLLIAGLIAGSLLSFSN